MEAHTDMQRLERHASLYGELANDLKSRDDDDSDMESVHERAPLLRRITTLPAPRLGATPLPKQQLAAILFLQLSEPVTSQCIYPFIVEVSIHIHESILKLRHISDRAHLASFQS